MLVIESGKIKFFNFSFFDKEDSCVDIETTMADWFTDTGYDKGSGFLWILDKSCIY